ncbi:ABC transporter permease [Ktedonosporobacter rubrisoli]|uniref:ABC transporter permease n=1 Tax=Ktedonosporobacter rubrisoli TaxID=2509675 RepID=A0A4P6JUA5_KTERU|nr:ABC transporter permease [Ktedonosporobacter rubrisoli]QBD78890.1 ABC transporter permease [Ktedonosporobacter rubrisoli]
MGKYLIRRLLEAIPLLILISILMFLLIHLLPGGPEAALYNPNLDEQGRAALRASLGLDDPLPVQYLKWIGSALHGQFGFSFATNQPVSDVIMSHFPPTLELFASALVLALIVSIFLGIISAVRQRSITDYAITTISYFGISMPIFLLGLFLQDILGTSLHWLPTSGMSTPGYLFDPFNAFLDHFLHLLMPMLVLAITFTAKWSRYLRSSMIEVTRQDYMRTGRAKGVAPVPLLLRHALRNAVIPLITIVAIDFGSVAGGATITEGVFAWPGMGSLFIVSLEKRDFPILLATLMLGAVFVVLFNIIADILYAVMDPRIRYA